MLPERTQIIKSFLSCSESSSPTSRLYLHKPHKIKSTQPGVVLRYPTHKLLRASLVPDSGSELRTRGSMGGLEKETGWRGQFGVKEQPWAFCKISVLNQGLKDTPQTEAEDQCPIHPPIKANIGALPIAQFHSPSVCPRKLLPAPGQCDYHLLPVSFSST